MKRKKLIVLTSQFPYGTGEQFLETEILFLSKAFEQVIIVSNDTESSNKRTLPENCEALRFVQALSRKEKVQASFAKTSKTYKEEKSYVENTLNLAMSGTIRNTILVSMFRANKLSKFLRKLLKEDDLSEVVCYSFWCDDNAIGLANLRGEFPELKAVSRVHGWDLYFEASTINYLPFRTTVAEGLSNVYPISDKGLRYIQERWKVSTDKVQVRRLGTFGKGQVVPTGKFILVSCSNLIPLKRVDLIATALSKISGIELEWVHFGSGGELDKVKSLVQSMPSNITVELKGQTSNKDILDWYGSNAPHLFVNVSTTEGIPVSIMEAMSFGTPVVATDVGGTSELVNSTNGELIPADINSKELAIRIQAFFKMEKSLQDEKRQGAFDTWNSKYNAEINYTKFSEELAN